MGTRIGAGVAAVLIASGMGLWAWQQAKRPSKPVPPPAVADSGSLTAPISDASSPVDPIHSESPPVPSAKTNEDATDHSLTSASGSPVAGPADTSERSFRVKATPVPEVMHDAPAAEAMTGAPHIETPSIADSSPRPTLFPESTPIPEPVKDAPFARIVTTPSPTTPPATAPAEAEKITTHIVVMGETYSSIAKKYLGAEKYASLIAKANPGKDPRKLQPGNKLMIPAAPKREASAAPREVKPEGTSERAHEPSASAPPLASDRAYTVKPGETWHVLAQRFLGDAKRWPELYEMNVERAPRNPDGLRAGTVIEVPQGVKPTTNPS